MKNAYWMRYPEKSDVGGYNHVAVIADDLDEAFKKLATELSINEKEITYRNREVKVLI